MHLIAAAGTVVSSPHPSVFHNPCFSSNHRELCTSAPLRRRRDFALVRCSISKVHNYGTVDYENKKALKWSSLYRRIAMMEDPEAGTAGVLQGWEAEERTLGKWELCRVAKELRKFRRFKLALEVYEWMGAQGTRFNFTSSDLAIQLDLIAKVHGISQAEEYFSQLPDVLKDKRTYGALVNAYGNARMKEKAEAVVDIMKRKGFATDALVYNVMMTLYMNVGENEKIDMIIQEMRERSVPLDVYSYNIWITNCAAMENVEEMEWVFEQMASDSSINANWTTYTTLASMYIKLGAKEKAFHYLKEAEIRMTGRNRLSFNHLLGLYAAVGKKEDIFRVWSRYKSSFPSILNLGYQAMLSALIKLQDNEGAENIFDEWLSVTPLPDPRICNLLMGWYARQGLTLKAKSVLNRMVEKGGKPKAITWEILAEGYILEKQIFEALSCLQEAASFEGTHNYLWRPKPVNVANFLALCKEQNNMESMHVFVDMLKNRGCLENVEYESLVSSYTEALVPGRR
ncbi:putative tetratricopeptide-like helical domain superfamily [Dioscorea sansibarensis]